MEPVSAMPARHWLLTAARSEMPVDSINRTEENDPAPIMLRALEAIATGTVTAGSTLDNLHLARTIASDALRLSGHPGFTQKPLAVGDEVQYIGIPGIKGQVEAVEDLPGGLQNLRVRGAKTGEVFNNHPDKWERVG